MKTCRYCGTEIESDDTGPWKQWRSSAMSPHTSISSYCQVNRSGYYHQPYARIDPLTVSAVVEQLRRIARETAL